MAMGLCKFSCRPTCAFLSAAEIELLQPLSFEDDSGCRYFSRGGMSSCCWFLWIWGHVCGRYNWIEQLSTQWNNLYQTWTHGPQRWWHTAVVVFMTLHISALLCFIGSVDITQALQRKNIVPQRIGVGGTFLTLDKYLSWVMTLSLSERTVTTDTLLCSKVIQSYATCH